VRPPLSTLCIPQQSTLRRAIEVIDAGGAAIALVVEESGRLAGTLTDGDIRRALLAGAALEDAVLPFVQRDFVAVPPDGERAAVLDLMQARRISQVPIIESDGRLVGLHLLRELIGAEELPNVAVVMAGGRGTRLHPYTASTPKPMVLVAGRPILERIVLHLVGSGVRRVFLAVNHMAEVIEDHFGDGAQLGCSIEYLREDHARPLGTAGALRLLPDHVTRSEHPLLVMNGDLLTSFPVASMLEAHRASSAGITIGVAEYSHQVPFGVITTRDGNLDMLEEKPTVTWTVNAGIYVIDSALVERIPMRDEYFMTQLVDTCLAAGERIGVHPVGPQWHDVGRPADLRRVHGEEL
jgi:dTDP-glucose pyrophosphorylase